MTTYDADTFDADAFDADEQVTRLTLRGRVTDIDVDTADDATTVTVRIER